MDRGGEIPEMRACSACAGDYEDPDCTAWAPDEAENAADAQRRGGELDASPEEFPAAN